MTRLHGVSLLVSQSVGFVSASDKEMHPATAKHLYPVPGKAEGEGDAAIRQSP
jgi:hypothetical protein